VSQNSFVTINPPEVAAKADVRSITFRDCTIGGVETIPSQVRDWTAINCDCSAAAQVEVDKLVANISYIGGSVSSLLVQSPVPRVLTLNGVHVTGNLVGTGLSTSFENCNAIWSLRCADWRQRSDVAECFDVLVPGCKYDLFTSSQWRDSQHRDRHDSERHSSLALGHED
jgi:hypothetical protein